MTLMPGCIIEMLDPVSRIRRLVTPISTEMEGVPCSNRTELTGAMTAFSGVLRRRGCLPSRLVRVSFREVCLDANGGLPLEEPEASNAQ